jgi:squalene-hopene/tetraprenyl-beta-curcumene cyclase
MLRAGQLDLERLSAALDKTGGDLLAARAPEGHWIGELSSSALSTATALIALSVAQRESSFHAPPTVLRSGLNWLVHQVNQDGGWGDTILSISNISTTALCWAAFGTTSGEGASHGSLLSRVEDYLQREIEAVGGLLGKDGRESEHRRAPLDPAMLAQAIINRYGKDRTFSAPILTACALAGRSGTGREAWRRVIPLPFELAALPHQFFAALRLPVVSYALPALIAIGQARHFHLPSRNPVVRLVRHITRRRTLRVLEEIQPHGGGFLEATPLTSFVVMSLAASGQADHPVTRRSLEFLLSSQRADGSWPIDTNLATWLTTMAVNALSQYPERRVGDTNCDWRSPIRQWLLKQQYRAEHPYTHAAPGGWAWTDLSGGVPDADDTAGAVLALANLTGPREEDPEALAAAVAGSQWLLDLQNRDGGIPTFCRGWGALPFDRSSADLTAHAVRAWLAWIDQVPPDFRAKLERAINRALGFLEKTQAKDGSWLPLWFGNQFERRDENPTYGTARVVEALCGARTRFPSADPLVARGVAWLLRAQKRAVSDGAMDGSWGGGMDAPCTVEETALAVEALSAVLALKTLPAGISRMELESGVVLGTNWLLAQVESGEWTRSSPIGFYFAKLWYYEKLYPRIFTVGALGGVGTALRTRKLGLGQNTGRAAEGS